MGCYYDFSEDYYFFNKIRKRGRYIKFKKFFGEDEHHVLNLPQKMSNAKAAHFKEIDNLYCNFCMPNKGCNRLFGQQDKKKRNWKYHRKHQFND